MHQIDELSHLYKYHFSIDFNLENAWRTLNRTCSYAQIPFEDFLQLIELEIAYDDRQINNFRMYIDTFHHKSKKNFAEKWVEILSAIILHHSERRNTDASLVQIIREIIFSKYNYQFLLNRIALKCHGIPFELDHLYAELKELGGIDFRDVSQHEFLIAYKSNFQNIPPGLVWGCKELLAYFLFAPQEQPPGKLSQVYCTMIALHNDVSGIYDVDDSIIVGNVHHIFNNSKDVYRLLEQYGFYVDVLMHRYKNGSRDSTEI